MARSVLMVNFRDEKFHKAEDLEKGLPKGTYGK
jgi:hypothetical protein